MARDRAMDQDVKRMVALIKSGRLVGRVGVDRPN
jgi:hypothetical protein